MRNVRGGWSKVSPLLSAAPPFITRATMTAPVASSRRIVAPCDITGQRSGVSAGVSADSLLLITFILLTVFYSRYAQVICSLQYITASVCVSLTNGSLFLTSRTIFTDSSSSSSSKSSGRGGRMGSKFFWATVSCTDSMA